jgi:outer membrane receptor protein involved in Fe transport
MTIKRMHQSIFRLMILTLFVCLGTVALHAQTSTEGSIAGTVSDPAGAVVSGVAVTIHNMGTNAEIKLITDASGFFKAPLLEPGTYKVTFSAPGFSTYHADNVIVLVGQVTSVLPHLTVGASSSSVEVVEQAPVVNLESPDFSESLNAKALQQIPINNRRWSALAMTTPGVVSDSNGYGLVAVRGISPLLNNVEIDGADDNQAFFSEERGRTREAYSTSGSAVREFAVNTGVYSAEYGRAAGGVITSVTKSGTNQIHGQAYFWDRESKWNAFNDYTTISELINGTNTPVHIKPEDLRKIYGFTVGGPLIKDKLFWVYTYDQHTHVFPVVGVPDNPQTYYTMPTQTTALMPAGESCTLTGVNAGQLVLATGVTAGSLNDADACALAARQGISYNTAAADWYNLVNGAAAPTNGGVADLGLSSDIGEVSRFGYQEINTPKLDWQVNSKNHVSVLYHRLRWDSPGGVQTAASDHDAKDYQGNDYVKLDYGVIKLTTLISANIGNELLYQYGRENDNEGQQTFTPYSHADLQSSTGNIPQVGIASSKAAFSAGAPYYSFRTAYPVENKWQVGDVLYWNHGNQALKFGVDMVHNNDFQNDLYESNGAFSFTYFGNYMNDELNFKNGLTSAQVTANNLGCNATAAENYSVSSKGVVTYPLGGGPCYSSLYQGFGTPTYQIDTMDTGVFAQDNWKVTPRLTMELGLRWDYEALPPADPNLTTAATANGITFVPYPGLTNNPSDKTNFGPRVGFSYDVTGKGNTVVRGGYGMYYGRITNGNLLQVRLGTGSPLGQINPETASASATAGQPTFPNILSGNTSTITPTSYFLSPNLRSPGVQEYDLMVQQGVGNGTFVQLSYLGALGRHLPNFLDMNLDPTTVTAGTMTVIDASGLGPLPNGTVYPISLYTKYGNTNLFGAAASGFTTISEMVSNVNSNYNAGVVEVLNRSLKNLQFDASYTWSHALDFAQNALTQGSTSAWYDPYGNPRVNYGNSSYNVPNRGVAYALYKFPNVHSDNWLSRVLINDWNVDDSFQIQDGLPYTAGASGYVNKSAFSDWNGAGGSSVIPMIGINTKRYRRKIVDDARLEKDISFERGRSLQLMANMFNVSNHQNIDGVITTTAYSLNSTATNAGTATFQGQPNTTNSGFGVPNSSNSSGFLYTPREIEIAARFSF